MMIGLIAIGITGYVFWRNWKIQKEAIEQVSRFRYDILYRCSILGSVGYCEAFAIFDGLPDFDIMLYSPKPLVMDEWLTPKQCRILRKIDDIDVALFRAEREAVSEMGKQLKHGNRDF